MIKRITHYFWNLLFPKPVTPVTPSVEQIMQVFGWDDLEKYFSDRSYRYISNETSSTPEHTSFKDRKRIYRKYWRAKGQYFLELGRKGPNSPEAFKIYKRIQNVEKEWQAFHHRTPKRVSLPLIPHPSFIESG